MKFGQCGTLERRIVKASFQNSGFGVNAFMKCTSEKSTHQLSFGIIAPFWSSSLSFLLQLQEQKQAVRMSSCDCQHQGPKHRPGLLL